MRLREIRKQIEDIKPLIKISATPRNSKPPTFQLTNVLELQEVVKALDKLGLFPVHIDQLKTQSFHTYASNVLIIQPAEYNVINKVINELLAITTGLITSLDIVLPDENEETVSIKIPNPHNFEDIEKTANILNKIFSQTLLNKDINGSIRVVNFDTGTYWIDFLVGGMAVLNFVGGLSYSAAVVYKKMQEGRLLQEKVKELKLSNNAFKELVTRCNEKTNEIAENEAEYLNNKYYKSKDHEQLIRIKVAIKELAKLFEKGAEIYPSISANEEIIETFPDFKKIEAIESRIKKLGGKK